MTCSFMRQWPPDVVLLAPEWQPRACIRAQLIEEGFSVIASDTWPMMRRHLRPRVKPRVALVDLKGLPNPARVLQELHALMRCERVLVLTAMGTVSPTDVERLGFQALSRPVDIEAVVRAASRLMQSSSKRSPNNASG
jgi:hypothetical protein